MNYKKSTFWIVVLAAISCITIALCFLTNPITVGDHLVLADSNSPADSNNLSYDIRLGNEAMSGEIYVEQWINGTCTKSAPVTMTLHVDSIDISMSERKEGSTIVGTDIQIGTNQYAGSLLTYFAHPADLNINGWSFTGYQLNQKIQIAPGDEVILAAKAFDSGNGVRVYDCETLIEEPERLESAEYMIIVRAIFSADTIGATKQGETSSPKEVLTLNDVITLSQKGYDLLWADFDQYDYRETGSGLYIRVYEINDSFELWIGGAGPFGDSKYPDSEPKYMYLKTTDSEDSKIDIRDGGVAEFISAHETIEKPNTYYLTVGAEGAKRIEVTTPYSSGGCENADGSLFKPGKRILLESLNGYHDLHGVTITAKDANGHDIFSVRISDYYDSKNPNEPIVCDEWVITPVKE